MAISTAARVLERLLREVIKKDGIEAGIALGRRFKMPQKVVSMALVRSLKKNPYGTFAQRKTARIKSMEKAQMLGGGMTSRQQNAEAAGMVNPLRRLRKGEF